MIRRRALAELVRRIHGGALLGVPDFTTVVGGGQSLETGGTSMAGRAVGGGRGFVLHKL